MIRINRKIVNAIGNLLEDIEKQYRVNDPKQQLYVREGNISNVYMESGVLTENGKAITVEQFLEKYGVNERIFTEKIRQLVEMSTANFVEGKTEIFRKNFIEMTEKLGLHNDYVEWLKTLTDKQFYALYDIDPTMQATVELYHESVDYLIDYYFGEETPKTEQAIKNAARQVIKREKAREK